MFHCGGPQQTKERVGNPGQLVPSCSNTTGISAALIVCMFGFSFFFYSRCPLFQIIVHCFIINSLLSQLKSSISWTDEVRLESSWTMCTEEVVVVMEVCPQEEGSEETLHVSEWEGPRWTTWAGGTVRFQGLEPRNVLQLNSSEQWGLWKRGEEAGGNRWRRASARIKESVRGGG